MRSSPQPAVRAPDLDAHGPSVGDFDRFIFIVGAPRCGTTSLSRFLKNHPAVAFPLIKEPHFWAQDDLRHLSDDELKRHVERHYLQHFFRKDPTRRIGADASVTYLYAPEQLEPILRLWPESRFVISVRDPLDMLPSLHRRLVYVGVETLPSLAKAWAASADRAAGRRIPRKCFDPRLLRYDEACRFSTYVERLFAVVGRERCQVLLFDDLATQPAEQYRRFMDFIGLDPQDDVDFSPRRQGQSVRSRWLQRMLKRPPKLITDRLAAEMLAPSAAEPKQKEATAARRVLALRKRLLRWNRVSRPAESLSPALEAEICANLRDEIDRLGALLNRDLSHWLQPRAEYRLATAERWRREPLTPAPAE